MDPLNEDEMEDAEMAEAHMKFELVELRGKLQMVEKSVLSLQEGIETANRER